MKWKCVCDTPDWKKGTTFDEPQCSHCVEVLSNLHEAGYEIRPGQAVSGLQALSAEEAERECRKRSIPPAGARLIYKQGLVLARLVPEEDQ